MNRRVWTLLLIALGIPVVIWLLPHALLPSPSILAVSVVDSKSGEPLSGVSVWVRTGDGRALPVGTTDEKGRVRFQDLAPGPDYRIRVQKVDYALTLKSGISVTRGQETQIAVALTPSPGGRLFVGLDGAMIAEVDTASLLVVRTVHLPGEEEEVNHLLTHPSESLLYAIARGEGYILDTQSWTLLEDFEVEGTVEALTMDGTHLCLVTRRDADANVSLGVRLRGDGALGVMAVSDGNELSGQLLTLDARTGALLSSRAAIDPRLAFQLIWRPNGSEVYVVDPFGRSLWVLGISPQEVLALTPTGVYPREGFPSADGHHRYTWATAFLKDRKGTLPLDWQPVLPQQSLPLDRPSLALSSVGPSLYVMDAWLDTLSILDPAGEEPRVVMPVGKQPVALLLSADGTHAYVANRESRSISVVQLRSAKVVHTIALPGKPFSLAISRNAIPG